VSYYQPLITKFDKYLTGWKARLLSTGGCLVSVNTVLNNLAIYFMSATLLPKTVVEALRPVRLTYQPPASSTFLSEQTSTSNQPAVLFSQNKSAPAISHQPNEHAVGSS
jgi:hypothetical protein